LPGYDTGWQSLVIAAGAAPDIVNRLNAAMLEGSRAIVRPIIADWLPENL
jgi:hypothetical protein